MGTALAKRLLAGGHEVVIWDRTPGRAADVLGAGGAEAPSVVEAVEGVEVVIVMVSNDDAVRQVALGEDGVRHAIGPNATYVECSTISPKLSEELAGSFDHFVAMPVLGGPPAVEAGKVTYLAGADEETLHLIGPVLASLGGTVRRYPTAHLAFSAKLAVNMLLLSGIVSLAESFAVGRSGGLSDEQLRDLVGGLAAPNIKNRFEAVLGAPFEGWWSAALGAKDAGLAIELAGTAGVQLPGATAVREAYLLASRSGYGYDIAGVHHLYERMLGGA